MKTRRKLKTSISEAEMDMVNEQEEIAHGIEWDLDIDDLEDVDLDPEPSDVGFDENFDSNDGDFFR